MGRSRRFAMLCLVMATTLAACGPATPPPNQSGEAAGAPPQAPTRITAAVLSNIPSISDAAGGGAGKDELRRVIHSGLTDGDHTGILRPKLAEAVPTIENGLWKLLPDGKMETSWTIRPGAQWHDGTPFTTADLIFTVGVIQDRKLALPVNPAFASIQAIEPVNERTVTVRWSKPYIEADVFFTVRTMLIMPRHLLEAKYAEGVDLLQLPYWGTEWVGLGPYRVQEWQDGSHLLLRSFDAYTLGKPKIDTIELKFFSDVNATMANLLAGSVDVTIGRGITLDQAAELAPRWADGHIDHGAKNHWVALYPQMINPNPEVIANTQFRQALIHAVDRQSIADTVMFGIVPVAHTGLTPSNPLYQDILDRAIVKYEYDPRKAAQLIESLGYTRQADALYVSPAGTPLSVEVMSSAGLDIHNKMAAVTGDFWKRAGIGTDVRVLNNSQGTPEVEATRPGFVLKRQSTEIRQVVAGFHSSQVPSPETRFRGDNLARYANTELDGLLDRFQVTIPQRERLTALGEALRYVSANAIAIPLTHDSQPTLVGNRLVNAFGKGEGETTSVWNIHEWDLR